MTMVNPDFSEAVELGAVIPDDVYKVRVVKEPAIKKIADPKDPAHNKRMLVVFQIVEGDHARIPLIEGMMTSGPGSARLQTFLKVAGLANGPFDTASLVGAEFTVTTKQTEYQGKKRSEVDTFVVRTK